MLVLVSQPLGSWCEKQECSLGDVLQVWRERQAAAGEQIRYKVRNFCALQIAWAAENLVNTLFWRLLR